MKIQKKETTVDITGAEIKEMLADKISFEMGEDSVDIQNVAITYRYEKREDGKGYRKTDQIKRVRITL